MRPVSLAHRMVAAIGRRRSLLVATVTLLAVACGNDPGFAGRSSGDWAAQLAERDVDRRVDAAEALGRVLALQPNATSVIEALVRALADSTDAVRVAAADALQHAARGRGEARARLLRDAVPGVVALLADSAHPSVRRQAAQVLGGFGAPAASATVPPLARALADVSPDVRASAALALAALTPAAREAMPPLASAVGDPDVRVRTIVARTLAESDAPSSVVGPALVRAMRDGDARVREAAASGLAARGAHGLDALASSGVDAVALLDALREGVRDPVADVRVAAVVSLGLLGDSASRAALRRALRDFDPAVRREAEHALSALHRQGGRDPAPAEPSLLELCRSNPRWPGC